MRRQTGHSILTDSRKLPTDYYLDVVPSVVML
jgi:hypothetical protein